MPTSGFGRTSKARVRSCCSFGLSPKVMSTPPHFGLPDSMTAAAHSPTSVDARSRRRRSLLRASSPVSTANMRWNAPIYAGANCACDCLSLEAQTRSRRQAPREQRVVVASQQPVPQRPSSYGSDHRAPYPTSEPRCARRRLHQWNQACLAVAFARRLSAPYRQS